MSPLPYSLSYFSCPFVLVQVWLWRNITERRTWNRGVVADKPCAAWAALSTAKAG